MKKLMALMTLVMTLSLAACGSEDAAASQSSVPNSPESIADTMSLVTSTQSMQEAVWMI